MNLCVFFDFEPKNCFRCPDSTVSVGGGLGQALMQFIQFLAIFAILPVADLGDPVVPTLRGVSGDVVIVYAY